MTQRRCSPVCFRRHSDPRVSVLAHSVGEGRASPHPISGTPALAGGRPGAPPLAGKGRRGWMGENEAGALHGVVRR